VFLAVGSKGPAEMEGVEGWGGDRIHRKGKEGCGRKGWEERYC